MPKISVIVPIYNAEKNIERCIKSILGQTYSNFELLLIDDGSKDKSIEICNQYSKMDNRVSVYHKKNEGVSKTRNYGIEKAKGQYLQFIDSDDYIERNMLDNMVKQIEKNDSDLCICGFEYSYREPMENKKNYASNQLLHIESKEYIKKYMASHIENNILLPVWNKLFKLTIIKDNNIRFNENISLSEDFAFVLEYLCRAHKICLLDSINIHYCIDKGRKSLSSSYEYENVVLANKIICDNIDKMNIDENVLKSINYQMFDLILNYITSIQNSKKSYNDKIKLLKKIRNESFFEKIINNIYTIDIKKKVKVKLIKNKLYHIYMIFV